MRNLYLVPLALATILVTHGAAALEHPTAEQLGKRLASALPPYWSVSKTTVTASVNAGDAVDPEIKQRFQAMVAPSRALFAVDQGSADVLTPYVPIVPTVGPEQTRTVYGVARSTYKTGNWHIEFELENDVAALGRPKGMFAGPTLVRGSQREDEVQAVLAADIAQNIQQKAQAKIQSQKAHNAETLRAIKAAHTSRLADLKARFKAAKRQLESEQQTLATKRQTHKTRIAKRRKQIEAEKAEHAAKMRRLKAKNAKALDQLEARQAAEKRVQAQQLAKLKASNNHALAQTRQNHRNKLEALKTANQTEIESINKAHDAAVTQLKARQKRRLAALAQNNQQTLDMIRAKYASRADALREKIEQTGTLVALQTKRAQEDTKLAAARRQTMDSRAKHNRDLLAAFREKIGADQKDARRSAFAAALESDNRLLRQTALRVALEGKDPILQETALQKGLQSSDQEVRRATIKLGLGSDDADRRARALSAALSSDDTILGHRALKTIIGNTNAITGTYTDDDESRPVTISITKFDPASGALKAQMLGWSYCDEDYPLTGNLTGTQITLGNDRNCGAHYSLSDEGKMTGMLTDHNRNRYESRATIGN